MDFKQGEERYFRDSTFKSLVDTLHAAMQNLHITPSELRDAAMYAQIKFEMENPQNTKFSPYLDEMLRRAGYERK